MHVFAEILILGQLLSGPKHGYEIKKDVQETLGEAFEINNNLLYPALRRFLERGVISKQVVKCEGKPDKNVYCLTDAGERAFQALICEFPRKFAASDNEFLVRVAFLDRLEYEAQQEILQKRQDVLHEKLMYYRGIECVAPEMPFAMEVVRFQRARVEHELEWINSLQHKTRERRE